MPQGRRAAIGSHSPAANPTEVCETTTASTRTRTRPSGTVAPPRITTKAEPIATAPKPATMTGATAHAATIHRGRAKGSAHHSALRRREPSHAPRAAQIGAMNTSVMAAPAESATG